VGERASRKKGKEDARRLLGRTIEEEKLKDNSGDKKSKKVSKKRGA